MIRFSCPNCGNVAVVDESQANQRIECPKCGNVNVAPPAPANAGSVPPIPTPPTPGSKTPMTQGEERNWAMFCHLAALALLVLPSLGNIIGPLIVWLIKKDESPLVNAEGKKALNFQITMSIAGLIAAVLCFALIGFIILPIIAIYTLIMIILAAVRTANGEEFTYPTSIPFLK